jgi:tyrosyl-tRNA synthetase
VLQGYDSVAMNIDVEWCGTDQIFNSLMGRQYVKNHLGKEKFVVACKMLCNPLTGELMSKSNGTGVFLAEDPDTMFGHIMSLPDSFIEPLLRWLTRLPIKTITALDVVNKAMEAKLFTAEQIVSIVYNSQSASEAKNNFVKTFSKRKFPIDAPEIKIMDSTPLIDVLKICLPDKSKADLKRLAQQGAITCNGEKWLDVTQTVNFTGGESIWMYKILTLNQYFLHLIRFRAKYF